MENPALERTRNLMDDLSALLLTVGEEEFLKAEVSVRKQSLPPVAVHIVKNESPFARAFNKGVCLVETPYFVQVDADMNLDLECFEVLRRAVHANVGVVIGHLRDPLQGIIQGVKLFKTQFCRDFPLQDTLTCETDQVRLLDSAGLESVILDRDITLGTHRLIPGDSTYIFERFWLLGRKARSRQSWWNVGFRLGNLGRSGLPQSILAAAAFACGFWHQNYQNFQKPLDLVSSLQRYLEREKSASRHLGSLTLPEPMEGAFLRGLQMDKSMRPSSVVGRCLEVNTPRSWSFLLGYSANLFSPDATTPPDPPQGLLPQLERQWST